MNFKTTIILLIALSAVAGIFFYTGAGEKKPQSNEQTNPILGVGAKVLDLQPEQVVRVGITSADGKQITLAKTESGWRMSGPADAASPDWAVRGFIGAFAEVTSSGHPADTDSSQTGLDKPAYRIEFQTADGKITDLSLGNKTSLGDLVYAQVGGGDVNLIPASLKDAMETVGDQLRDHHLFSSQTMDAQQIQITYGGSQISLVKNDGKWQILQPQQLPGDSTQIESLLNSLLNAQASDFVKPDAPELAYASFDHPTLVAWASAQPPSTQPALVEPLTTRPSGTGGITLTIGAPTSLSKDAYFAKSSDGVVAKISSDVVNSLEKSPLDLRDRNVLNIAPADVTGISIIHNIYAPATTLPAGLRRLPAKTQKLLFVRRPVAAQPIGPALDATRPATIPSGPATIWEFPDDPNTPVDDSKVAALLGQFQPLRVEDYRATPSTGLPLDETFIDLTTRSATYHLQLDSYVEGAMPIGSYNGLLFDISSDLMDTLNTSFRLTPAPALK
jgi:hypothetical protein